MTRQRFQWILGALFLSAILVACADVGYYAQCVTGQWHLMSQRRVITEVIADPSTPPALRDRLKTVIEIRNFSSDELTLPENGSYRSYADLKRPYAVWNVVAAPEFSLEPVTWCFPVAGCVPYRGYFDPDDAREFAAKLKDKGYDVHLYGVPAYSTLNWFDDPVLNTFCLSGETQVAGLIFHELAHQKLYVQDAPEFNEAFAQTVELIGVERWLIAKDNEELVEEFRTQYLREKEFISLILDTQRRLQEIYDGHRDEKSMKSAKQRQMDEFRNRFQHLKNEWGGYEGFDYWARRPLNNAHFASVSTYHELVPAFLALLSRNGGDLEKFFTAAQKLAELPPDKRSVALNELHPVPTIASTPSESRSASNERNDEINN